MNSIDTIPPSTQELRQDHLRDPWSVKWLACNALPNKLAAVYRVALGVLSTPVHLVLNVFGGVCFKAERYRLAYSFLKFLYGCRQLVYYNTVNAKWDPEGAFSELEVFWPSKQDLKFKVQTLWTRIFTPCRECAKTKVISETPPNPYEKVSGNEDKVSGNEDEDSDSLEAVNRDTVFPNFF